MKNAIVLEGPGFSEQGDVLRNLSFAGVRLVQKTLGANAAIELGQAEFLILRGPWSHSAEERLLTSIMAQKLSELLLAPQGPAVLAVGRGALIVLEALFGAALNWESTFTDGARWQRVQQVTSGQTLMGLVLGRAQPVLPEKTPAGLGIEPWLRTEEGDIVAWRIGGRFLVSPLDILAYAERTQLPDFGYSDLTQILTQAQVIDAFVRGES